jgi:hypothetical protein
MSPPLLRQSYNFDRDAKKYGIATEKERLLRPGRYNWERIERDVNALLTRRRDLSSGAPGAATDREGKRQTYPEEFVKHVADIYLRCCAIEKRAPSLELARLISQLLNAADFGVKGGDDAKTIEAQEIRSVEKAISNRALAKRVGVDISTIGRWVKEGLLPPPDRGVAG